MFDLERELEDWRGEMKATGLAPEVLLELEEHVREDFHRQVRAGVTAPDALKAALQRIGQPKALRREFDLVGQSGVKDTLRRHKWKLLFCSGAGLLAAVVLQVVRPAPYQSEAKFLVRYIVAEGQFSGTNRVPSTSPDLERVGNEVMGTEAGILSSFELARRVAEKISPEKILRKSGGGDHLAEAIALIRNGLQVAVIGSSSVIHLSFRHPDSEVSQTLLRELIDQYLRMHVEVHRASGGNVFAVGKVSNISQITAPTPPVFDFAPLFRMQALLVGASVMIGFGWVVILRLIELRLKAAD